MRLLLHSRMPTTAGYTIPLTLSFLDWCSIGGFWALQSNLKCLVSSVKLLTAAKQQTVFLATLWSSWDRERASFQRTQER